MTDEEPTPGDKPRWTLTWLFRIQRIGHRPGAGDPSKRAMFSRIFPWVVVLILLAEVAVLVAGGFRLN